MSQCGLLGAEAFRISTEKHLTGPGPDRMVGRSDDSHSPRRHWRSKLKPDDKHGGIPSGQLSSPCRPGSLITHNSPTARHAATLARWLRSSDSSHTTSRGTTSSRASACPGKLCLQADPSYFRLGGIELLSAFSQLADLLGSAIRSPALKERGPAVLDDGEWHRAFTGIFGARRSKTAGVLRL